MPRARGTDPDARRFGDILFHLRARQNWTLHDLAKHSGMHKDYLGRLERGLNVPTLSTILRLAETFEVSPGQLVDQVAAGRPKMLRRSE